MSPAKKPMTKAERLAALKERLASTEVGYGGSGYLAVKEGTTVIRILPGVGDMNFFYQEVGVHVFPGKDGKRVYCPRFISQGELDCPICEVVDQLYKAGDASSKALAKQLSVGRKYWMNVVNRDDKDPTVKIWTAGVKVFQQLMSRINDPDYGDVTDEEDGFDLKLSREGTGLETSYDLVPRTKPSVLGTEEEVEKWLGMAKDLSWVQVSDDPDEDAELSNGHAIFVLPYDRIMSEYDLDNLDAGDLEEVEPEEEPVRNRKHVAEKTPVGKHSKADEDDDVEPDDDEDEDYKPRGHVARRSTRR